LSDEVLATTIYIYDQDFNKLYYSNIPITSYSNEPDWVIVDIPDIGVDGDFYVVFYTNSTRKGGVYLHFDTNLTCPQ
jgi:hypothetical protein